MQTFNPLTYVRCLISCGSGSTGYYTFPPILPSIIRFFFNQWLFGGSLSSEGKRPFHGSLWCMLVRARIGEGTHPPLLNGHQKCKATDLFSAKDSRIFLVPLIFPQTFLCFKVSDIQDSIPAAAIDVLQCELEKHGG